ncbi:hypothetical protein PICMEDRAFT_74027 [Pichia membranifaciens NRRL Y-2026]|uniref:Nucleoporin NUP188 n=1 Tax=Pichia membranifaciens NRRL Y-2026 TaxID=763406 RepID=A0A1E3NGP8_9ASCO|nr:hypothetical protein PICMEDRAFT_74027 [Pichia membranifaciens NRRL Y-2026]ODQ45256.1 hypothetical protein PICMEDRAFT_74027 [Pichia membranifaciens NRRL Y-2026]
MSPVKKDEDTSSDLTFDGGCALLTAMPSGIADEKEQLQVFFSSHKAAFVSGKLPYAKESGSSTQLTAAGAGEYSEQVGFISEKLDLDSSKVAQLVDIFAKRIRNCPNYNNKNVQLFTATDTAWSSSNNDSLTYFVSMILQQQIIYYKLSSQILRKQHINSASDIRTDIQKNGHNIIDNLMADIEALNELQNKLLVSSELDLLISNNLIALLLELLNYFVYTILQSQKGFKNTSVLKWFELMEKTSFLSSFAILSINSTDETKSTVETLATIITLLFLDLDFNFGSLEDQSTFMSSPDSLNEITKRLLSTKANPIVLYAWSIILHRQHIILEMHKGELRAQDYERSLSSGALKNLETMYLSFAGEAAQLNVCNALTTCNELISYDPFLSSIFGSFVIAFTPYIEPTDDIIKTISAILRKSSNDVVAKFFDSSFTDEMLILLKAKMPLSLNSYLELISINSNLAVEELRAMPTFMTYVNSADFLSKYSIDDQQPELVKLTADFNIQLPFEPNDELSLLMRKDTKAQVLSKVNGKEETLVLFLYDYNGWSLLGRIMKNLSVRLCIDQTEKNNTRKTLFKVLARVFMNIDEAVIGLILNSMNSFVEDQDVIDISFRIFDQAIMLKDTELLANCLTFFNILSEKGYAYRIWSFLYKSNLFGSRPNGNLVYDVLDKIETTSGSYEFITSLLILGNTLSKSSLTINENVNINLKSQVIEYFTTLAIQIFENFSVWKYQTDYEKYQIGINIISFLKQIVQVKISVANNTNNSVFEVFEPSLKKIVNSFLVGDINDLRAVSPLLLTIEQLSNPKMKLLTTSRSGLMAHRWISECFEFSTQIVQLRSLSRANLPSNLERELYSNLINLINVYLFNTSFRKQILNLLTKLIQSNWNDKPPSVLTHLRTTHSIILLNCLYEDISTPTSNSDLKVALLNFLASTMENNQKGLSLFLITGTILPDAKSVVSEGKYSLFRLLRSLVANITDYTGKLTYHLLKSMLLCLSIWHGSCSDNDDMTFVEKLLDIIKNNTIAESAEPNVWKVEIIAKTVEIISLYLFVSRGKCKKCESKIFNLLNSSDFLHSLEAKFKIKLRDEQSIKLISEKFSKFSNGKFQLGQFLHIEQSKDGDGIGNAVYDFNLLDLIFDNKDDWAQVKRQVENISLDIQIIDSQIHLAKAYGGLVTCFCNISPKEISTEYCLLASSLLKINYEDGIPFQLYDEIYKGRIELAFLIVLTISQSKKSIKDSTLIAILTSCLDLLESREVNLSQGLASLKIDYYKPLLRILLICVSMIKTPEFVSEYSSTLLELFRNIICESINTLFNGIRSSALSVPVSEFGDSPLIMKQIDDILNILSLTQEYFKLKLNDDLESELSNIVIQTGAYRAIAHMFSSSHLIKINNEEVFTDYSLSFIYEFVQRKAIAARLLDNGIFHLITESPVGLIIQKGHISPYSSNSTIGRLHRLWTERILPIVLLLVSHFGNSITFSLSQFALTFKNQFKYTIQTWLETDSLLSASIIEETEQIILFAKLLNSLDCYSFVGSELGKPLEEVHLVPGLDTPQERKVFVNALTYLLSHPKYLALKVRTVEGGITVNQLADALKSLKDSLLM